MPSCGPAFSGSTQKNGGRHENNETQGNEDLGDDETALTGCVQVLWLPDRIYGCNWFYEGQFTLLARRNVRSFRAVASAERCSVCVA